MNHAADEDRFFGNLVEDGVRAVVNLPILAGLELGSDFANPRASFQLLTMLTQTLHEGAGRCWISFGDVGGDFCKVAFG